MANANPKLFKNIPVLKLYLKEAWVDSNRDKEPKAVRATMNYIFLNRADKNPNSNIWKKKMIMTNDQN